MKYKQLSTLILFSILFLGCSNDTLEGKIKLLETKEEMKVEVYRHIKIGLPIQEARGIMEVDGFICDDNIDTNVADEHRDPNGKLLNQNIVRADFVNCTKSRSYFLALQIWRIAFIYENQKVVKILTAVHWQQA